MDTKTLHTLRMINNDFYRRNCASFSATRGAPWTGWARCVEVLEEHGFWDRARAHNASLRIASGSIDARKAQYQDISVFDLACGNLRFEEFLGEKLPDIDFTFYAVDNCEDLLPKESMSTTSRHSAQPAQAESTNTPVHYQSLDVLECLEQGEQIDGILEAPPCDLSASFGFMHHIPSQQHRMTILNTLAERTSQNGFIIVSFWQFLNNTALAEKAKTTHARALKDLGLYEVADKLDDNDFLLGWKDTQGTYRYCHSFSECEIDELARSIEGKATVVSRFVSDGRTENLNTYLILKKR